MEEVDGEIYVKWKCPHCGMTNYSVYYHEEEYDICWDCGEKVKVWAEF